jgi:hypothetical protein
MVWATPGFNDCQRTFHAAACHDQVTQLLVEPAHVIEDPRSLGTVSTQYSLAYFQSSFHKRACTVQVALQAENPSQVTECRGSFGVIWSKFTLENIYCTFQVPAGPCQVTFLFEQIGEIFVPAGRGRMISSLYLFVDLQGAHQAGMCSIQVSL